MNILKRTTLILLSISMFTAFSVPVFAEENFKEADPVTYNLQEDIRDGEYNVVGTKYIEANVHVEDTEQGQQTTLVETYRYNFSKNEEKYKKLFPNETTTTEILVTDDGDYYINGKKLSDKELETPYTSTSQENLVNFKPSEMSLAAANNLDGNLVRC